MHAWARRTRTFMVEALSAVIRMRRAAAEPDKKNDDKRAEVEGGGDPAGAAAKRSGVPDRLGRALL